MNDPRRPPLQVVPVLYALTILLLITSVYAILATQLYGDQRPEQFGRFTLALFTVTPPPTPRNPSLAQASSDL